MAALVLMLHSAAGWAAGPVTVALPSSFGDLVVDDANQRVFVSAPAQNEVLVFDFSGNRVATLQNVPGAEGMVVDGASLYVAESTAGAVETFDLATLADQGPLATGLVDPQSLAFADGEVWATESPSGVFGQIASVSPGGVVTAFPLPYFDPEQLTTSPATPDLLYAYVDGDVEKLDVSSGSPVLVAHGAAGQSSGGELAVSPDGSRLLSADAMMARSNAELSAATLSSDGTVYPSQMGESLAVAVSPGNGGLVAFGFQAAGAGVNVPNIEVFKIGSPASFLSLSTGSSNGQSNNLQDVESNGLAMSADASKLFAVVSGNIYRTWFSLAIFDLGGAWSGAPVELSSPSITGVPQEGQTLQLDPGNWQGATKFTYDWWACNPWCTPVTVSSGSSPLLLTNEAGEQIFAYVTASNAAGSITTYTANSAPVAPEPVPTVITVPSVSGAAQVGDVLSASPGSWTNSPRSFSYQWLRSTSAGWVPITGASTNTYVVTAADEGSSLEAQVIADNWGGFGSPAMSGPVLVPYPTVTNQAPSGGPNGSSGSSSPTVPPVTSPPTVTVVSVSRADLTPVLRPSGKSASLPTILKHRGYIFRFTAPRPGTLSVAWTAVVGHKRLTVAKTEQIVSHAGPVKLTIHLTGQGARCMKRSSRLRIRAAVSFKAPGASTVSATASFTLSRT